VPRPGMRERLRYRFDSTMSKGTPALIGLLALASLLLVLVVGALAVIFGDDGAARTLWMSMMRTLDPGTMADDEGSGVFLFLMLMVTIGGIFVVAALIGVLNTGLASKLEELRKGRSSLAESGHTVVLGWSEQVFTVVAELVLANESEPRSCVAILADEDKVVMEDELRARVGHTGTTRVVCRTGSPTEPTDLDILRLGSAKSIIVMSPEDDEPDVHVIKTLLALSNRAWSEPRPHVFAAVAVAQNLAAARLAGGPHATVVDAEDVAARLLVQTCRQGGLSAVCTDLLGFAGEELYLRAEPTLVGMTFGEALYAYETATMIGLYRVDGTAAVNPPMDVRIEASDQLIMLAEDDSTIRLAEQRPTIVADAIRTVGPTADKPERILLLGWNARAVRVIEHLDRYVAAGSELQIAAHAIHTVVDLDDLSARMQHLQLSYQECEITDRAALEALNIGSFDDVGVLTNDELDGDHADGRTLVTLLHLRDMQSRLGERYSIVSEMNDERNRKLAEVTRADDFVVSGKLVSLLLTQLSENQHLAQVFDVLFDATGSEIHLKPAEDYVCPGERINFATMIEAARHRNETAMGYRLQAQSLEPPGYGVNLNPDKHQPVVFHPDDQVIVLSRGMTTDPLLP
jgi:voltage-gated potassium channel Kch